MMASPWPAPAKLNRILHITGRRDDGMHELQTIFQFIDLCDQLEFNIRSDGVVEHLNPLAGVAAQTDLTVRAARLLQSHTGCSLGVDIHVDKQLPMGGGLGGGSSDCATTLVALNQLWELGLTDAELAVLGLQLGADVPVFIHGRAAWAEGVGERLTPVAIDEPWFLVIRPDCEVPTAMVFNAPDLTRSTPPMTIRDFLEAPEQGRNDCEAVVRRLFPPVAEALDWLARFAPPRLTGTGACLFAPFPDAAAAADVAAQLPGRWQGHVCRGCNESPLRARREQELR